jgi:hypothetical protein
VAGELFCNDRSAVHPNSLTDGPVNVRYRSTYRRLSEYVWLTSGVLLARRVREWWACRCDERPNG